MPGWVRTALAALWRLVRPPKPPPPAGGRVVFRYSDGSAVVGADPLRLRAELDRACPEWAKMAGDLVEAQRAGETAAAGGLDLGPKLSAELDARSGRLVASLVQAVRAAFGVKPYAELNGLALGLTDLECLDLLADYLVWVGELMEETRPFASSPPPTGAGPATSTSAPGSDSPSTPAASAASAPA